MNTFFRVAVYLTFAMMAFNLIIAFIGGLNAFPIENVPGTGMVNESTVLPTFTDGRINDMDMVWAGVIGLGFIGSVVLAGITRSMTPIGLYLFSAVFWTAYTQSHIILSTGGFIPGEFLAIFGGLMVFLYIAAIIGMISGSG